MSRPFLEQCVRDRVYRESRNIEVVHDTMVDFEVAADVVKGVHLRGGGFVPCDLYVDAAGRSSILPALLAKHSIGRPEKVAVDAKIKSASRLVKVRRVTSADTLARSHALTRARTTPVRQVPDGFDEEWKLLVIKSLPNGTKGGSLLPMEGGVWQVTLADAGAEGIALTNEGFLHFAEQLPDKGMHGNLSVAVPLSDVVEYRAMRNEKLLFDRIDLPAGLLPIGDSGGY